MPIATFPTQTVNGEPAPNTCIKYSHDCGWYAMLDGKVLDDGTGISGTFAQAWERLAAIFDANRIPAADMPGWEYLPY